MGRLDRLLDGDAVAAVSMDAVEIAAARFDEESGSAAERARFGLARHAGCWWIVD